MKLRRLQLIPLTPSGVLAGHKDRRIEPVINEQLVVEIAKLREQVLHRLRIGQLALQLSSDVSLRRRGD